MNSEKGQEMATKMFVNIPVHDLKQSMEFFAKLGFTFNPHFTDDTAACMVVVRQLRHALDTRQVQDLYAQSHL